MEQGVQSDATVGMALHRLRQLDHHSGADEQVRQLVGRIEQVAVLGATYSLIEIAPIMADQDQMAAWPDGTCC